MTVLYEPLTAWRSTEVAMTAEHARQLAATKVATVEPASGGETWLVTTGSKVGVVVGDGWEIRIRPKLLIPKLMFLLAYSLRPDGWRDLSSDFGASDFFEAVASGFSYHAERALLPGVLHGYRVVDEREPGVRGRVRFADQFARLPGLPLPVELTYDEFSADITENQMLRAAAELLLRFPRVPPAARRRLRWVRAALDEVSMPMDTRRTTAPPTTRLNARYEASLALAELILQRSSIIAEHGRTRSTTFLFDMNEVFESFLYAALDEAFRRFGGTLRRHAPIRLDVEEGLRMEPDMTWWKPAARCRAVIDAKYKSLVDRATMPNADAYQMLAYCVALGLPRGFLIYAKDAGELTRVHRIRRHDYVIDVRAVDVELPPEKLLDQVSEIACVIAEPLAAAA